MDLSKFKRRRISAVRDYPIQFGVNLRKEQEEVALVQKKYPPPKIRKGFTVMRDFPVNLIVPIALRNQISDSKGSNSDNGIPMEDCQGLDVSNCTDASQSNTSTARDSKPPNVPIASDACDIHVCMKPNNEDVGETSLLMNIGDEQCQAGLCSLANYQVAHEDCQSYTSFTKGASSSTVVDVQCLNSMFGVHDSEETFNVEDFDNVHDSQAAFNDDKECVKAAEVNDSKVGPSNDELVTNNELKNDRDKVKEIISLFREVCNDLLRDNKGKSKTGYSSEAASILLERHKWIKRDKHLGPIQGIEVGDHFDWRAELNIIGLHCRNIHGIDYMKLDEKLLAISVVDSRRYDNIFESKEGEFPDSLIYLGEGENPKLKGKKPIEDQKLTAGNLALKNSAEAKTPIRVIRKFFYKCGKIEKHKYVYDGLYFADSYRQEIASSGKLVFKFLLKKFPAQPKLDLTEVRKLYD
ncbi:hypothetical protein V6N13_061165 [Hibiscus sabdariffa]|uniref:YDG domain-containing protein n=1 Tax=Hibiscus sabdariffa TaxID=183260 RepID=A0ABR2EGK4_9ROSI